MTVYPVLSMIMKTVVLYYIGIVLFSAKCDFGQCLRLRIIPAVPTVRKFDTDFVDDVIVKTRRYGRKSEYIVNVEFTSKHLWTNSNVSVDFNFYEYLHNEYRPSFVEMHFKFCDLILKDMVFGPVARKSGLTICPLPPGKHRLMNVTYDQEFPSVWPFEKGKVELILRLQPSGKEFVKGDLAVTFITTKT